MAILKKDKEGKIMDKMENVVRNFKRGIITLDEAETCVKETYMEYFEMLKNNKRLSLKDFTDHHNYLLENLYQSLKDIEKHSLPKDRMGEIITVDTLIGYLNKESQKEVITCLELDSRNSKYIKENEVCKILSYKGNVFGVEPPFFVELLIVKAEPGVVGNTATNVTKTAVLETGAEIKVPMFVNEGERVRIDTRTGEYMERA